MCEKARFCSPCVSLFGSNAVAVSSTLTRWSEFYWSGLGLNEIVSYFEPRQNVIKSWQSPSLRLYLLVTMCKARQLNPSFMLISQLLVFVEWIKSVIVKNVSKVLLAQKREREREREREWLKSFILFLIWRVARCAYTHCLLAKLQIYENDISYKSEAKIGCYLSVYNTSRTTKNFKHVGLAIWAFIHGELKSDLTA